MILSSWSFSTYSQISNERIKRANELIIKGQMCDSLLLNKVAQIEEKDAQIKELESIRSIQDSIIFNSNQMIVLTDSIVMEKVKVIEGKDKEIKKLKRKTRLILIGSVILLVLVFI